MQKPHSSPHKQRNHFSCEPNEIIIIGTTGIIAVSYYYATPLECMILFWLFFFLLGRWRIVLIIHSHSETSLTSTNCFLEDHQAENMFIQLSMIINCLSNHSAVYHSKQCLSYYHSKRNSFLYLCKPSFENLHPTAHHADNKGKINYVIYTASLHPRCCKIFLLSE